MFHESSGEWGAGSDGKYFLYSGTLVLSFSFKRQSKIVRFYLFDHYSTFQIDELHGHNKNPVGTFHRTPPLWSTDINTAVLWNTSQNFSVKLLLTTEVNRKEQGNKVDYTILPWIGQCSC